MKRDRGIYRKKQREGEKERVGERGSEREEMVFRVRKKEWEVERERERKGERERECVCVNVMNRPTC